MKKTTEKSKTKPIENESETHREGTATIQFSKEVILNIARLSLGERNRFEHDITNLRPPKLVMTTFTDAVKKADPDTDYQTIMDRYEITKIWETGVPAFGFVAEAEKYYMGKPYGDGFRSYKMDSADLEITDHFRLIMGFVVPKVENQPTTVELELITPSAPNIVPPTESALEYLIIPHFPLGDPLLLFP